MDPNAPKKSSKKGSAADIKSKGNPPYPPYSLYILVYIDLPPPTYILVYIKELIQCPHEQIKLIYLLTLINIIHPLPSRTSIYTPSQADSTNILTHPNQHNHTFPLSHIFIPAGYRIPAGYNAYGTGGLNPIALIILLIAIAAGVYFSQMKK